MESDAMFHVTFLLVLVVPAVPNIVGHVENNVMHVDKDTR